MGFEGKTKMGGRRELVGKVAGGGVSLSEACREAKVSRATGYRRLRRTEAMGIEEMAELSRRPRHCPWATPTDVVAERRQLGRG
jgi:transposase